MSGLELVESVYRDFESWQHAEEAVRASVARYKRRVLLLSEDGRPLPESGGSLNRKGPRGATPPPRVTPGAPLDRTSPHTRAFQAGGPETSGAITRDPH